MFHGPPQEFLYSAYRVETEHHDSIGTVKSGVATAFVLDAGEKSPWITTNRHVVDLDFRQPTAKYKDFSLKRFSITGRRADDSSYSFDVHPDARFFFHSDVENDVVLIEPRIIWNDVPVSERSLFWHFTIEHLADETQFAQSIKPFDLVCYSGFPAQHDKLGDRPIIRGGNIASDPRFDYSWDQTHHGMCVAYEGFSFSGASGSPVLTLARGLEGMPDSRMGYLVGVNAGHLPEYSAGHSGISYFYKSTVVLDIVRENNLQGPNQALQTDAAKRRR